MLREVKVEKKNQSITQTPTKRQQKKNNNTSAGIS